MRRYPPRSDLDSRNKKILVLHLRHVHRKRIAQMMRMQYETVNKVIQKYQGPERRQIVRQNEAYEVGFTHSDR